MNNPISNRNHAFIEASTWIPGINIISGLTMLFIKCVFNPLSSQATVDGNYWLRKIDRDSFLTPIILLVPFFGRLAIYLYDRHAKKSALAYLQYQHASLANLRPWLRSDREVVLRAVAYHPCDLEHADRCLQNDRQIVKRAMFGNTDAYRFASEALQRDDTIQIDALGTSTNLSNLMTQFAEQRAPGTPNYNHADNVRFFTAALQKNSQACLYLPTWFPRDDKALVLLTVTRDPHALDLATEELQRDRDMHIAVIKITPALLAKIALQYNEDTPENRAFFMDAIQANGLALEHLPEWLFAPQCTEFLKNLTEEAVRQNPRALKHLPACLNQREHAAFLMQITERAIQHTYRQIPFLSLPSSLADNDTYKATIRDQVCLVLQRNPLLLQHAFPRERDTLSVVFAAGPYGSNHLALAMPFASTRIQALHRNAGQLRSDNEAMLNALNDDPSVLRHYGTLEQRNNKAFMLRAIALHPELYRDASPALQNDFEFALEAVSRDGWLFCHVDTALQYNITLARVAYAQQPNLRKRHDSLNPEWLAFVENPTLMESEENLLKAIDFDASALFHYGTEAQRKDRVFVLKALTINPQAFMYADEELQNDPTFVEEAATPDRSVLNYVRNPAAVIPFLRNVSVEFLEDCVHNFHPNISASDAVTGMLYRERGYWTKEIRQRPQHPRFYPVGAPGISFLSFAGSYNHDDVWH